jgi:hypothetical protein
MTQGMRRQTGIMVALVFGITFISLSLYAADWTSYGKDEDGDHFYKLDTSAKPSPGIVRVLTQVMFNAEGKARYIEKRKKYGFPTEGYDTLSHRNVLYELNCFSKKKEYSVQKVYELTADGKTLDYARAGTYKDWQETPPGSMLDKLSTIVCPQKR